MCNTLFPHALPGSILESDQGLAFSLETELVSGCPGFLGALIDFPSSLCNNVTVLWMDLGTPHSANCMRIHKPWGCKHLKMTQGRNQEEISSLLFTTQTD